MSNIGWLQEAGRFSFLWEWMTAHGFRILIIILLAVVGYRLFYLMAGQLARQIQRLDELEGSALDKRVDTIFRVITNTGFVVVVTSTTLTILQELDIEVAPLLASVGIVGLALGLGAQTLVKDMISGLFVLIENQYTVGDTITVGGLTGIVEQMTLRVTKVRDLEGVLHMMPNGEIRTVSNRSRGWSRAIVDVGISYSGDVEQALAVLGEIGNAMMTDDEVAPLLLEEPTVTGVEGLEDWQIRLRLMVKTMPGQHQAVQRYLRREIKETFQREGVTLASPRHEVVVVQGRDPLG